MTDVKFVNILLFKSASLRSPQGLPVISKEIACLAARPLASSLSLLAMTVLIIAFLPLQEAWAGSSYLEILNRNASFLYNKLGEKKREAKDFLLDVAKERTTPYQTKIKDYVNEAEGMIRTYREDTKRIKNMFDTTSSMYDTVARKTKEKLLQIAQSILFKDLPSVIINEQTTNHSSLLSKIMGGKEKDPFQATTSSESRTNATIPTKSHKWDISKLDLLQVFSNSFSKTMMSSKSIKADFVARAFNATVFRNSKAITSSFRNAVFAFVIPGRLLSLMGYTRQDVQDFSTRRPFLTSPTEYNYSTARTLASVGIVPGGVNAKYKKRVTRTEISAPPGGVTGAQPQWR